MASTEVASPGFLLQATCPEAVAAQQARLPSTRRGRGVGLFFLVYVVSRTQARALEAGGPGCSSWLWAAVPSASDGDHSSSVPAAGVSCGAREGQPGQSIWASDALQVPSECQLSLCAPRSSCAWPQVFFWLIGKLVNLLEQKHLKCFTGATKCLSRQVALRPCFKGTTPTRRT